MTISAVIIAKNEEKNIHRCLDSLSWCNEVVVVDDGSTDQTVAVSKKAGARVYTHALENNFAQQRNYALEKAKGDWVFFVDADEVVSHSLADEISSIVNRQSRLDRDQSSRPDADQPLTEIINGYSISRIDYMWGKPLLHGETGNIKLLRLAKKDTGKWVGKVHETWRIQGHVGILKQPLLHYPHPTITEFLQEINFYSTLRAQELFDEHAPFHFWDVVVYPKAKFVQNYYFKLGFLDGVPGLVVAILMSLHSFLVRGKLWQLKNN